MTLVTANCTSCGDAFTLDPHAKGRPRRRCYSCAPSRASTPPPAPPTPPTGTKCGWCHAYTPEGQPFCNPHHRSMFAQRVADAKRGRPHRQIDNGMYSIKKRPLERARDTAEALRKVRRPKQAAA